jgi:hypothetical protein
MGQASWSVKDNTNENTSFQVPMADLTAANIDAQYALVTAMQTALGGVCLGNLIRQNVQAKSSPLMVPAPASDPDAQREAKAMVIYADNTTFESAKCEVPCIDLTDQLPGHPGYFYDVNYAGDEDATWTAFVSAFEDIVVGPGGNAVTVVRIYHIGKAT